MPAGRSASSPKDSWNWRRSARRRRTGSGSSYPLDSDCDVNEDQEVNIADVNFIIGIILNS